MKNLIIYIFISYPVSVLLAQDKHDFSVEFNVNRTNYKMESLNGYLTDTNYFSSIFYDRNHEKTIKNGIDYNFLLSYQPLNFMDFGIYTSYQYASIKRPIRFVYDETPPYPGSSYIVEGENHVETTALSIGLSTHLYINKLIRWEQKQSPLLNRLQLSLGLMGGLGFSELTDRSSSYIVGSQISKPNESKKYQYHANNFQVRTELSIGYKIGGSIFSVVGFKIGYQFFKSSKLKNYAGYYLFPEVGYRSIKLDYSGVYYGIYIKLGK